MTAHELAHSWAQSGQEVWAPPVANNVMSQDIGDSYASGITESRDMTPGREQLNCYRFARGEQRSSTGST